MNGCAPGGNASHRSPPWREPCGKPRGVEEGLPLTFTPSTPLNRLRTLLHLQSPVDDVRSTILGAAAGAESYLAGRRRAGDDDLIADSG